MEHICKFLDVKATLENKINRNQKGDFDTFGLRIFHCSWLYLSSKLKSSFSCFLIKLMLQIGQWLELETRQ